MTNRLFPTFLLTAANVNPVQSQPYALELSLESKTDNSMEISAQKTAPGTYTVRIEFSSLQNTTWMQPIYETAVQSSGTILTLRPTHADEPVRCIYRYQYLTGRENTDPDTAFVYRLPYSSRCSARMRNLSQLRSATQTEEERKSWKAFQFRLEQGDTVYAVRKGIVTEIVDKYDPVPQEGHTSYHSYANRIKIEHEDGSIANYSVLQKGSFLVREGDTVYPDTPLALAGTYDNSHYQLRLMLYVYKKREPGKFRFMSIYLNPYFLTDEGPVKLQDNALYTPAITDELITQEMTKKEVKRRKGKK